MNGIRYFFDTNAIIALLKGNYSLEKKIPQAESIGISVISIIEFLSFPNLSRKDKGSFGIFVSRVTVVNISDGLGYFESVARFKLENKLKLPDALIGYSAIENGATLISNDKHFQNINSLSVLTF